MRKKDTPRVDTTAKILREGPVELRAHMIQAEAEAWVLLRPLFDRLCEAGVLVKSLDSLQADKSLYRKALPAILAFLEESNEKRVKQILIGLLKTKWAKPDSAEVLIREFKQDRSLEYGLIWDIADALTYSATRKDLREIVPLFINKRYGTGRQMLAFVMSKFGTEDQSVKEALIQGLRDDEVMGHAIRALGRLRIAEARDKISQLTLHPNRWIRAEAKQALKRI